VSITGGHVLACGAVFLALKVFPRVVEANTKHLQSTFFAPNSAAAIAHLSPNRDRAYYDSLLDFHIVDELIFSADLKKGLVLPTFNGSTIDITVDAEGQMYANNVRITGTDYLVYNGVMHVIDE
jgi:uncharacterized surface protein with fasciclin (FAS1) repeats